MFPVYSTAYYLQNLIKHAVDFGLAVAARHFAYNTGY